MRPVCIEMSSTTAVTLHGATRRSSCGSGVHLASSCCCRGSHRRSSQQKNIFAFLRILRMLTPTAGKGPRAPLRSPASGSSPAGRRPAWPVVEALKPRASGMVIILLAGAIVPLLLYAARSAGTPRGRLPLHLLVAPFQAPEATPLSDPPPRYPRARTGARCASETIRLRKRVADSTSALPFLFLSPWNKRRSARRWDCAGTGIGRRAPPAPLQSVAAAGHQCARGDDAGGRPAEPRPTA